MVSVAHIVEKIIRERPYLEEALSRGIINNAALSEELKSEIEKELKKTVKFSAINMAIRRLSEKLEGKLAGKAKFDKNSDITIKSNLIEITVYKMEDVQNIMKQIYKIVDFKKGDFLTITQGLYEVMIITNEKHEKKILELLPEKLIKKKINGASSITINIPLESIETPGYFYLITRVLTWENINIIDIVSTLTEMTFIIREEDTARAFNILKKLMEINS